MTKKAFITGIRDQDGSYLAELLLSKGYEVHGLIRQDSTFNTTRIDHLLVNPFVPERKIFLYHGDLSDAGRLTDLFYDIKPDEIYDTASEDTGHDILGITRLLEAVRRSGIKTRFYHSSGFSVFGGAPSPYNENTVFHPGNPGAAAAAYSFWVTASYREGSNKLFTCNAILFDHESPRMYESMPTRKTTRAVAHILAGKEKYLYLGTLEPQRDFGYAPEYVQAMWLMLQQDEPDDYVIGTGEGHSLTEWAKEAFEYVGLDWQQYVRKDPRPHGSGAGPAALADAAKAKRKLGWEPKVKFKELIRIMVDVEMEALGLTPPGEGKTILAKYNLNTIDKASGTIGRLEEWPGLKKF